MNDGKTPGVKAHSSNSKIASTVTVTGTRSKRISGDDARRNTRKRRLESDGPVKTTEVIKNPTLSTINTCTNIGDDDSDDLTADQMAFSIDHIREQICASLLDQDLCNCRLVCRSWNSWASLELQKQPRLKFCIGEEEFKRFWSRIEKRPETMLTLPLPFSKFKFSKKLSTRTRSFSYFMQDGMLQAFLSNYGMAFRELSFYCERDDIRIPTEGEVIEIITNLLLYQTRNLSKLEINLDYSVSWKAGSSNRCEFSSLRTSDPEFQEIHSKFEKLNSPKNTKLKILSLRSVSSKLLEAVILLAPNLEEVIIDNACTDEDLIYFVEPLNRIKFLKQIKFCPTTTKEFKIFQQIYDHLATSHEKTLKLRTLCLDFQRKNEIVTFRQEFDPFPPLKLLDSPAMGVQAEIVISRFLESSWNSLETIKLNSARMLPELRWPEVMPNVLNIELGSSDEFEPAPYSFPQGFSWLATFPKLQFLTLQGLVDRESFGVWLNNFFKGEIITNMKVVYVYGSVEWDAITVALSATTATNFKLLKILFPNAKVECYVHWKFRPLWHPEAHHARNLRFF